MEDAETGTSPGPGARLLSPSRWSHVALCCSLINEVSGGEGVLWSQTTHLIAVGFGLIFLNTLKAFILLSGMQLEIQTHLGLLPLIVHFVPGTLALSSDSSPSTVCLPEPDLFPKCFNLTVRISF